MRDARSQQTIFFPDAELPYILTSIGQSSNIKDMLASNRIATGTVRLVDPKAAALLGASCILLFM